MSLSSVELELPPGFRFHPKDEELICDYLMKMVMGCPGQSPSLIIVDLNKCEPWDIPQSACVGEKEWYFYSQRDRKYATGLRTNRATVSGYWKATGKDRAVIRKDILVGMRKTLVFYQGRAPKGKKTCWVMHEFRLEETIGPGPKMGSPIKEDWVLCRVFYKNSSETHSMKQETEDTCRDDNRSSPPSLPTVLMESQIKLNQIINQSCTNDLYNQQVPCFSMYNTNLTNPCMPRVNHMDPPQIITSFANFGYPSNEQSCDDQKVIKAVLNQLTMKESPSFGEGISDSYLSEVGLSSMWSNF